MGSKGGRTCYHEKAPNPKQVVHGPVNGGPQSGKV
jgi:hypothetical protein